MGRVVVVDSNKLRASEFTAPSGLSMSGAIESRAVLATPDRPLFVWQHELEPGGVVQFTQPNIGHVIYVRRGEADVDGAALRENGALIVSHSGDATLKVGASRATLLHFYKPEHSPERTTREGGCAHVVNYGDAQYYRCGMPDMDGAVYVDSGCPTCETWFHQNRYWPGTAAPRHFHTCDEIIFITGGTMMLGRRKLGGGTAIAVDANTVYRFSTADDELTFVNFRAIEPGVVVIGREGKGPVIKERVDIAERVALTRSDQLRGATSF